MKKYLFILFLFIPIIVGAADLHKWNTSILSQDNTAPTVLFTGANGVQSNGTTWLGTFSEFVSGSVGTWSGSCSTAGAVTLSSCALGAAPSTTISCSGSPTVNSGDTCTITSSGTSIVDRAGRALTNASALSTTNNSNQSACDDTTGMDVAEGFEGTGTPTGWTVEGSGIANFDYTTTHLQDDQSLRLNENGNYARVIIPITSGGTQYAHILYQVADATPANDVSIAIFRDSGGNAVCTLLHRTTGVMRLVHGSTYGGNGATTMSDNTAYHIWFSCAKGTGANGTAAAYISTTKTKPGAADTSLSDGTGTADMAQLVFVAYNEGNTDKIFDQVRVDQSDIGNVCD